MRKKLTALAVGLGATTLIATACVEPNQPTLAGVTMQPGACNGPQGRWAGCSQWDSVTFTFYNSVPSGRTVNYTGAVLPPVSGGGNEGPKFEIDGAQRFIGVKFTGTVAHDARGRGTAQASIYGDGMRLTSQTLFREDYEGYVQYVIGMNSTRVPAIKTWVQGKTFTVAIG